MIDNFSIESIISKPVNIHVVAEMGAGKSTFLDLLEAYEDWLRQKEGLHGKLLVKKYVEDIPHHLWEKYQEVIHRGVQDSVVYDVQSWFAEQKLGFVYGAAGIDYPTQEIYKKELDMRESGLYMVERSPQEDYHVFAAIHRDLFPNGLYEKYKNTYGPMIERSPNPDLIVRLSVSPEVSLRRVNERGLGETFELGDYYRMKGTYMKEIDPWILESDIPCIWIDTGINTFDFNTRSGQNYFLTAFLEGLMDHGFWKLDGHYLPAGTLLNLNSKHQESS